MTREEIKNKIFEYLKGQVVSIQATPNQTQQLQLGGIYSLFPIVGTEPRWQNEKILSIAREIMQELENNFSRGPSSTGFLVPILPQLVPNFPAY